MSTDEGAQYIFRALAIDSQEYQTNVITILKSGMGSSLLVVNSGSSSLKFKLFNRAADKLSAVVTGLVERIGDTEHSRLVATNEKDASNPGKQVFQVR